MLKASGAGTIIFISSIASYLAINVGAVYGAAKGMHYIPIICSC